MAMTKRCLGCGKDKSRNQFGLSPLSSDGYLHLCLDCLPEMLASRRVTEAAATLRQRGIQPYIRIGVTP